MADPDLARVRRAAADGARRGPAGPSTSRSACPAGSRAGSGSPRPPRQAVLRPGRRSSAARALGDRPRRDRPWPPRVSFGSIRTSRPSTRSRRGRRGAGLGHRGRRPDAPLPHRVGGRREDALHHELLLGLTTHDGPRARARARRAGRRAPRTTPSRTRSRRPRRWQRRDEAFYREVVRSGLPGAALRCSSPRLVAGGEVDLETLADGVARRAPRRGGRSATARRCPGVGPYAAAHIMMTLGRNSRLILDSWTRPTYARAGRPSDAPRGRHRSRAASGATAPRRGSPSGCSSRATGSTDPERVAPEPFPARGCPRTWPRAILPGAPSDPRGPTPEP